MAVYMVVHDEKGRVLLLRRGKQVKHFAGCWELPGGKPAPDENFARTAELEVDEETGLYVAPQAVAGAAEGSIPGTRVAMLVLEGLAAESKVRLSSEHDAYGWVTVNEARSLKLRPGYDTFFASYKGPATRQKSKRRPAARM